MAKKTTDAPTEKFNVTSRSRSEDDEFACEFKPVWMGFVHHKQLGTTDEEGLPLAIDDTMGKEIDRFRDALNKFGAKGWLPAMQVEFRSGDAYLIFKRRKVG